MNTKIVQHFCYISCTAHPGGPSFVCILSLSCLPLVVCGFACLQKPTHPKVSSFISIIIIQFYRQLAHRLLLLNSSSSAMNDLGEGKVCCDFHPEEIVVGVCAHCLKKRLLVLASKQGQLPSVPKKATKYSSRAMWRMHIIRIPKVLALAGPFLYRLDSRSQRRKDDSEDEEGSDGSHEDSFISVKFDDNGCAWWDTKESISTGTSTVTNIRSESNRNKHMVVAKTKKSNTFKWKKRLGQLLQLTQPKKANNKISSHLGLSSKVEGSKGRRGWVIRSLMRRKTTKR